MLTPRTGRTCRLSLLLAVALAALLFFAGGAEASVGDRLVEFRECVEVCLRENCSPESKPTTIPLHRRLLFWDCPSECDYACQHIITSRRLSAGHAVVQFHGKWPFRRLLGAQEPLSVLFSLGNLAAHWRGLRRLRAAVPASYTLLPFYEWYAYLGIAAWVFSAVFHTRDSNATERLDYFAAGATVLYGLYYTPVRLLRLDLPAASSPSSSSASGGRRRPWRPALRAWTALCLAAYAAHVCYLTLWKWDYGYNMAANVACGAVQNVLWGWYSWDKYRRSRRPWAVWPGIAVAWVTLAMSLELFDFPPLWGSVDAHSLWHLGTIAPTVLWYNFLIKDALDDIAGEERLKLKA
ncbi:Protein PER1 [Pleurostoma richardsiae]|uniref:Post-GPI attachment to proteins factor 3 n=1 Tax=Pleurostoma richardsiae TaxID=41990 RepID=A0AA38RRQ0_9PEZI|nr:Protein PER1 [Pleurostoma richardsiae]